ncbi:Right handed beta helix region [Curtobacterium sp. 9128]|uniref:right-handed parallel beta-helix repeat-containing protein n=1 Tax=Curtobacterium sp. 9128 TaxID=1793722 RepID=UPI0007D71CAF|nr:right-handed parallel beta-helix repeat-containing protein [Curtobacterium sp. 9128]SBN62178.1 Right handed beta helix region [Curtobacterium sp. 9128]
MRIDDVARTLTRRAALFGAAAAPGAVLIGRPLSARAASVPPAPTSASRSASDIDATRLQDVLDQAHPHAVVDVTRRWTLAEPLVVDQPLTLRFAGGSVATDRDIDLVHIRSSLVRVVDAVLDGPGAEHSGLGRGVRATGTAKAPLRDVRVTRARVHGFPHDGVLLEHCEGFVVDDCDIADVGYAGVLMFSCVRGSVTGNRIRRVTQPAPYPNSYGIEAVRATTTGLDDSPRSSRILIADNHVSGVPYWEGIDTHGGSSIAIVRNRVEDCRVGIAVVPSKDESDASATKYAPLDCSVVDNVVSRSTQGPGSGIIVRGAGETVGSAAERATGIVLRNTVTGYGDGDRDAGILVYLTRGVVLAHNRCTDGVRRGVSLYHSNEDLTLIGNVVAGLRPQGTATSVAVDVRATANTVVLLDNRYTAGATAPPVYGVQCRQADNDVVLVANDWRATTTPVVATAGAVTRYREE